MKLRNKKTGGIDDFRIEASGLEWTGYTSLKEFCEDYEDYEEPEEFWYINECGDVLKYTYDGGCSCPILEAKEIGNYFETEKEAEKAVEKLKAWKRLEDKGFKVDLWDYDGGNYQERIRTGRILFRVKDYEKNDKDLDLLFGGEDDN